MALLKTIRYVVKITGFKASASIPLVGLTAVGGEGTFTWDTDGEMLMEKWCDGFSKNIDIRRGGGYSSVSGGSLYLSNSTGLWDVLRELETSIIGGKIEIWIEYNNIGLNYQEQEPRDTVLWTGVVSSIEVAVDVVTIKHEDPSKHREAIISRRVDGDTYYPAVLGTVEKAKYIPIKKEVGYLLERQYEYMEENATIGNFDFGNKVTIGVPLNQPAAAHIFTNILQITDVLSVPTEYIKDIRVLDGLAHGNMPKDLYVLCVRGRGSGEAFKVNRITEDWRQGDTVLRYDMVLYPCDSVTVDGDRLRGAFLPAVETVGGNKEQAGVDDYDDISVFTLVMIDVRLACDSWLASEKVYPSSLRDVYSYVDNDYIKLDRDALVEKIESGEITNPNTLTMVPGRYLDFAEKVNTLAFLEGLRFSFGIPDDMMKAVNGLNRMKEEYARLFSLFDGQYPWRDSGGLFIDGVYDITTQLPKTITILQAGPIQYGVVGVANAARKDPTFMNIFNNSHDTEVNVYVQFPLGIASIHGVPFCFSFKRVPSVKEVMINYDVVVTLRPVSSWVGEPLPPTADETAWLNAAMERTGEGRTRMNHALLTTIFGSQRIGGTLATRSYMSDIQRSETAMLIGNGITERRIRCHRFNTSLNLRWPYAGDKETCFGALANNGCFYRQDMRQAPEDAIVMQRNLNHADERNGITQFISGYDAVRENGTPYSAVPPELGGVEELNFMGLLAYSGYAYDEDIIIRGSGLNSILLKKASIAHHIEFKNIQCIASVELGIDDGLYGHSPGRRTPYLRNGGEPYYIVGSGAAYGAVLLLQNYATAHSTAFVRPPDGWGTGPSFSGYSDDEYDNVIRQVVDVDSIYRLPARSRLTNLGRQLFAADELSTKNIKAELLRAMWCGGYIDASGRECIFSVFEQGGVQKTIYIHEYDEIIPGTISKLTGETKEDVFCQPSIEYDYDIGGDRFRRMISVVGIGTDNPRIVGNNAITDAEKDTLLDYSSRVYRRVQTINTPPNTLTQNKWIRDDKDAYNYLLNWLYWMGEGPDPMMDGSTDSTQRHVLTFSMPLRLAMAMHIDIGLHIKIELEIFGNVICHGLITGVSWELEKGREEVRCTATVRVPVARGGL